MFWERWSGGQCWWEVVVVLETRRKDQEWGDARHGDWAMPGAGAQGPRRPRKVNRVWRRCMGSAFRVSAGPFSLPMEVQHTHEMEDSAVTKGAYLAIEIGGIKSGLVCIE